MRPAPRALIVHESGDSLGPAVAERLIRADVEAVTVAAEDLSSCDVLLDRESFTVGGRAVHALLFFASPSARLGRSGPPPERAFREAETRALWLAALHRPVVTVNRYDEAAWFQGSRWQVWRARLREAGVPVTPLTVGGTGESARWLPWCSTRLRPTLGAGSPTLLSADTDATVAGSPILAFGDVAGGGERLDPALVSALERFGIRLARVQLDAENRVVTVDTAPLLGDAQQAAAPADLVAAEISAALRRR